MDDFFDRDAASKVFGRFNAKVRSCLDGRVKLAVPQSIVGCLGVVTPKSICGNMQLSAEVHVDRAPSVDYGAWHCSPEEMFAFLQMMEDSLFRLENEFFSFIELGAGWAPWTLNAMRYRQIYLGIHDERGLHPWQFMAVEGMKSHCYGIVQHAAINHFGLCPIYPHVLNAVVVHPSMLGKTVYFPTSAAPNVDWGQTFRSTPDPYSEPVEAISLSGIIDRPSLAGNVPPVWIIHSDIQGDEVDVFTVPSSLLRHRVANVIIGTHSLQGHDRLFVHFSSVLQWELVVSKNPVINSDVQEDGVLAFRNPAFVRKSNAT